MKPPKRDFRNYAKVPLPSTSEMYYTIDKTMRDIIPSRQHNRTTSRPVRVAPRVSTAPRRAVGETQYTTKTKTVTDIITPKKEVIITKTVTTTSVIERAPATKAIESLSADAKVEVLQRALLSAKRELRNERRKHRVVRIFGR